MESAEPKTKKAGRAANDKDLTVKRSRLSGFMTYVRRSAKWTCLRIIRIAAELIAVSLGLGIIWLGLLTSVMAKGEADISFLKRNFALWFAQAYDGQEAEISTFKVQWHPNRESLGFVVEDIIVKDEGDTPLLTVKSIYTETPVSALLQRGFEARRLDLEGGQFTIRRDENGAIFGAVGGPEAFGRLGPIIPIAESTSEDGSSGGGLIDAVSLSGTDVFFHDENTGLSLDLSGVDFRTDISDQEISAQGEASFAWVNTASNISETVSEDALKQQDKTAISDPSEGSGNLIPRVSLNVNRKRLGDKALDVSIEVIGLNPSHIHLDSDRFNFLKQIDTPINLSSTWRDVDTGERGVDFKLETVEKDVGLSLPYAGAIKSVSLAGEWDLDQDRLDLSDVNITADDVSLKGRAQVSNLITQRQSPNVPISFDLGLDALTWQAQSVLARRLEINKGQISGDYFADQDRIDLSQMSLPISDYIIKATGNFENLLQKPNANPASMKVSGEFEGELNEVELLALWPVNFILGGRNWVKSSIVGGTLFDMKFDLDVPDFSKLEGGLPDQAVKLDFQVRDGLVQYIRTMTPLDKASGYGQLRANGLDFTLTGGHVGELQLKTGRVKIPQFFPFGNDFTIEFEGDGPIADMVSLIDQKPFEYARIYNLNPEDFSGQGQAKLKITRPLREHFDNNRIHYDIDVKGTNVDAPFGLGNYRMTNGDLFLTADKTGMTIKGPAKIGPIDTTINWRENFDFGATPTTLNLTGRIDSAALDKLGLSLREYFGGDIPFTLQAQGEGVAFDTALINADLQDSEWVFKNFWSKPKGDAGELKLSIARNNNGQLSVENISAVASGLNVEGALKLDTNFRLLEANFSKLDIEDLVAASMTMKRDAPKQPIQATLSGDFLNLEDFVGATLWDSNGGAQVPLILSANMNTLRLAPEYQINKANLVYNHNGNMIEQFRFSGGNELGAVILDLQTLDEGPYSNRLSFDIANASDAADAFFKLDSLRGGRLYGEAIRPRDGDELIWSGTVNIDDVKLVNAPFLAQILSLASLDGLGNVLNGEGLQFETVELPFTWGEGVLGLEGARAAGPALGLTAHGSIDVRNQMIDMDGTLIPAYAANSFLGSIPILGDIFGGDSDDATLGLTYGVSGDFDSAQVGVNPLSALTPGILRQIFKPTRERKRIDVPSETP